MSKNLEIDPEFVAMTKVHAALKDLDAPTQKRVIEYVLQKLGLTVELFKGKQNLKSEEHREKPPTDNGTDNSEHQEDLRGDDIAGISPVAQKWLQRNGLQANQLSVVFSVAGDEIDLVADNVPGKSTRSRMRSVFLLKGVAAYLAGGAARFSHEKAKEACLHYQAYDKNNFSNNLRAIAPEVSGSKESGYTLTPRGLAKAAELVKDLIVPKSTESA